MDSKERKQIRETFKKAFRKWEGWICPELQEEQGITDVQDRLENKLKTYKDMVKAFDDLRRLHGPG